MLQTARNLGIEPIELATRNSGEFREMGRRVGSSNDDFIRTTEARHRKASQAIWNRMVEAGDIYKSSYAGWYSVRDEAYYAEDETRLTESGTRIGPQGRRSNGWRKKATSSACPLSEIVCWRITTRIQISLLLWSGATRSSLS